MYELKTILPLAAFFLLIACNENTKKSSSIPMEFKKIDLSYPVVQKDTTVIDDYFGTKISDPYRWLEDDQSAETKTWVKQQNMVTFGYLDQIPYRKTLLNRLTKVWNFEKFGTPFKRAGKYYFFKNDGLQNQYVLYGQDNLDAEAKVVLDPNKFSDDGTTSLGELSISKDGKYLAYSKSVGGSDWRTIYIKNIETGEELSDVVEWVKFSSISWQGDGFYYSRFPAPKEGEKLTGGNQFGMIYFHKVGTSQADDVLTFADRAQPNRFFGASTTDDEQFVLLSASESTSGNSLAFRARNSNESTFTPIVEALDKDYNVIDNLGSQLLVMTNKEASNQRLILIDTKNPAEANWKTLVAESDTDVMQSAILAGDKIICEYLHDASSLLKVFNLDGSFVKDIALPEIGSVGALSGKKGENQAFYSFQSFLRPNTIYSLDMATLESKLFKKPDLDFNPDNFTTSQVWYTSKDGTKVPMFVTHKKNIAMDKNNPTLLYGYGGFNISLTPSFSVSRAVFLENNGVYVVANLRGGGEFGEKWHKAGTKCQKQNVFDDFIGAAEHLIEKGYTNPKRLAIEGGSNGGLLVGACMTQRPELFGVAIPRVGVLDMLRYHEFTIGRAWSVDYGLSENKEEFECLRAYSPLHNLKETAYPATMVVTADHDDRVVPAHSFKFGTALQAAQTGAAPTLIRVETSAGHGAGKPTSKILAEAADLLSFIFYNMEVEIVE